ncbi:uncharacterized protein LOC144089674 [Stigmatopora argus]
MQAGDFARWQILTDLREELADRPQEQLGQMHVATAFVMPDALDNVEEEQEEKNGVQPTDRKVKACLPHPRASRGFELCPRHSADPCLTDIDVDKGDWQNNVTMRFFDSRRLWWESQTRPPPHLFIV